MPNKEEKKSSNRFDFNHFGTKMIESEQNHFGHRQMINRKGNKNEE